MQIFHLSFQFMIMEMREICVIMNFITFDSFFLLQLIFFIAKKEPWKSIKVKHSSSSMLLSRVAFGWFTHEIFFFLHSFLSWEHLQPYNTKELHQNKLGVPSNTELPIL